MYLLKTLVFLGQGIVLTNAAAACAADNCARAVTGTQKGPLFQATAKQDCSSFFQATVYPPTVTSTGYTTVYPSTTTLTITTLLVSESTTVFPFTDRVLTTYTTATETVISDVVSTVLSTVVSTITLIPTEPPRAPPRRRTIVPANLVSTPITVSPTKVPTYASACGGVARYSSACSCFGITKTTVTLPTPTSTKVITITGVATATQNVAFTNTETVSLTTTIISSVVDSETVTSTNSQTTTTLVTSTTTACVPAVPTGNILTNPGFNDGSFNGWNPGGNGLFLNSITTDAQCGAYGAKFTVSAASSYARIGQRFNVIDTKTSYKIQTYAKLVSGNPANCYYYITCQKPSSFSSADNIIRQIPVGEIPTEWTAFTINCPIAANQLTMSLSLQCNQGTGPVAIAIDEIAMSPVN